MKNLLPTLSLLLFLVTPLLSQHQWARQSVGDNVFAYDLATDPWDNLILVGNLTGTNTWGMYSLVEDGTVNDDGPSFLAKYDPNGAVSWIKGIKGKSSNNAWGVATDALGNSYVCGEFEQTNSSTELDFGGGIKLSGNDSQSLFLAKADSAGNFRWATSILASTGAGEQFVTPQDLVVVGGDIYVTGKVKASVTINGTVYNGNNTTNHNQLFVAKFDTAGNFSWFKHTNQTNNFGNADGKHIYWQNNQLYVIGDYSSHPLLWDTDTISVAPSGNNRHLLMGCFNANGDLLWHRWAASFGSADQEGLPVGIDNQGNLCTSIRTAGQTLLNDTSFQATGGRYLVKYDANGNRLYTRQLYALPSVGFPAVNVTAVKSLSDGKTLVWGNYGGTSLIIGQDTLPPDPGLISPNNFLAAFAPDGTPLDARIWADEYLGSFYEIEGRNMVLDSQGKLFTTGRIKEGGARIGNDTLNDRGGMFLVKTDPMSFLDLSTGIFGPKDAALSIQLFPNPAQDQLFIISKAPLRQPIQMKIFDLSGRQLLAQQLFLSNEATHEVDISSLPGGIYLLQFIGENGNASHAKLVKEQ